jgi:hypothetical protein
MNANLELIQDCLETPVTRRRIPRDARGAIDALAAAAGRLLSRAVQLARRWATPAVLTPRWWTPARTDHIDLNDPAFTQHSRILHELTRRM